MTDWIVYDLKGCDQFHCKRCGTLQDVSLPTSFEEFMADVDAFIDAHKRCKEPKLVSDVPDPCEWHPGAEGGRLSRGSDPFHSRAEVAVGAGRSYHLCRACAALPRFKRFRVRKDIKPRGVK